MKMEAVEVLRVDLGVVEQLGIGRHVPSIAFEDHRTVSGAGYILMAVTEALDDPGRFEVDEGRQIIGRMTRCQNADHPHFEWVDSGQVEQVLRRRDQTFTRFQTEFNSDLGAEYAITEQGQELTLFDRQPSKIEVIEGRADDWVTASLKTHIERNR